LVVGCWFSHNEGHEEQEEIFILYPTGMIIPRAKATRG
jgi:hypothetical protein